MNVEKKTVILLRGKIVTGFEIWGGGGGGTISDSMLEGTRHFFLPILYNFKNIGGHVRPLPPPLLRGPCVIVRRRLIFKICKITKADYKGCYLISWD